MKIPTLLLLAGAATAQEPLARKQIQAVRIEGSAPTVDGRLNEPAWQSGAVLSDLIQKQPNEGAAATERTEVRFLFDDEALYVGARMYAEKSASIQAPLSRRDNATQAERLLVSLDTYLDRRTAYTFGVTAAGTRLDWYHPADVEGQTDASWDPVWEARVQRDSLGWTAEMRIPFSQLRFNAGATGTWGLNLQRSNPATKEDAFWALVPSKETGWASRFGNLVGIAEVRPTRRVELMPYMASGATFTAEPGAGNPFNDGSTLSARVGGDVKMGIGPNLTLQGTVNPDFAQVEADPAEVNLSAFETFFGERRPFFTEGRQLLAGNGPNYFYSRRIGAGPREDVVDILLGRLVADYSFRDAPRTSTILGAAKLTGRLASGTSLGALAALTDRAYVRTFDDSTEVFDRVQVAPRAGYTVVRTQQEFGPSASTVGFTLTGMRRDLEGGDPLAGFLNRQAYAGGTDWNLRFKRGEYELTGDLGWSYVEGDSGAILRAQLHPVRYYQRPDAGHVAVDSSRTSLGGFNGSLGLARNSGRHWLWTTAVSARSPGFELNDAGAMGVADEVFGYANLRYRETQPGKVFRNYQIGVSSENQWNFGRVRTFSALRSDSEVTWKNFWRSTLTAWVDLRSQSDDLTRGGPLVGTGQAWVVITSLANSSSSRRRWNGRIYYGENEQGQQIYRLSGGVSVRPAPRWQFSVDPNYLRSINPRQYIATRGGGPEATFGNRYIFAFTDRSTFTVPLRLNYIVMPDLSLEMYAEPFAASGRFYDFGELPAARSRELRWYGTDGTSIQQQEDRSYLVSADGEQFRLRFRDFNVRSLRSNAVLRWEWRPGSTLYLVWQQDRSGFEPQGALVGPGSLLETLNAAGDNVLALKVTYWIPVR